MCSYVTEMLPVEGSAKGATGWFRVTDAADQAQQTSQVAYACVYYDHPVHALAEHAVTIDVRRPADGPAARVALELTAESARSLARTILQVLDGQETGC